MEGQWSLKELYLSFEDVSFVNDLKNIEVLLQTVWWNCS